jgi:2-oxoisovalerate dehydrogenase E2 component (dihydrolipoyl transacylase)
MGMATQTPNGLMVPSSATRDMSVWGIASESSASPRLPAPARRRARSFRGSTITISSLGPMAASPRAVINRPEVAIIAVNKVEEKPVVIEGDLEIRKRMNLSLSCDHRVVDGWDAANFLQDLKKLIEAPLKLLSL